MSSSERSQGIDTFKLIASFAVICLLSLGIYLLHPFIYQILLVLRTSIPPLVWDMALTFIVFTITSVIVTLLKTNSLAKKLII